MWFASLKLPSWPSSLQNLWFCLSAIAQLRKSGLSHNVRMFPNSRVKQPRPQKKGLRAVPLSRTIWQRFRVVASTTRPVSTKSLVRDSCCDSCCSVFKPLWGCRRLAPRRLLCRWSQRTPSWPLGSRSDVMFNWCLIVEFSPKRWLFDRSLSSLDG